MHIIHISSEIAPIAKIGGLGDVLYGLPRETLHLGHNTEVIIPKYDILDMDSVEDLRLVIKKLPCVFDGNGYCSVWSGIVGGIKVYFIDVHHPRRYFNRGCIYGCEDDTSRFLFFSRAVLEFLHTQDIKPHILHLHDWHTAAVAPLYKDLYEEKGNSSVKIVLTIHNMEYQGRCSPADIDRVGLKSSKHYTQKSMQDTKYPEAVNLLQGGIIYSDFITTVSPTYAQEVKTPSYGYGLDKLLTTVSHKFGGILNGIDYDYWNPANDPYLPRHYSNRSYPKNKRITSTIDRKGYIKKFLRQKLDLDQTDRPIVASVSRLVPQKGLEFIKHAIENIVSMSGQFVLIGSSPIPAINEEFHKLKRKYEDNPHVSINLQHEEDLAHLIFAGSDILIVPSHFEPCGLTQMIALRYGTVPLARRTGGLSDTIFDVDASGKPFDEANGYIFDQLTLEAFDQALNRAIQCWFKEPDKWHRLMMNGMNFNFSWKKPAKTYLEMYKKILGT